jgi:Xaa-Pro aminopeptidase
LLNRAAAMVDGAYQLINEQLKPGVRENDIVAEVNKFLYTHGSDDVEAINAISGERCNPHPHNFTDRMIRPGDQAFFDILQSFMGYRTCYYRTFNVGRATPSQHDAYKKAREWLDNAIARIKPGASTAHICEVFPKANEFGFPDEMSAFGLQFAHGLGLALHERPIISRVVSMDHPTEIKEGMVFAIETYCPASDGFSAARIEEEGRGHRQGLPRDLAIPGGGIADQSPVLSDAHPHDLSPAENAAAGQGASRQPHLRHALAARDPAAPVRDHGLWLQRPGAAVPAQCGRAARHPVRDAGVVGDRAREISRSTSG